MKSYIWPLLILVIALGQIASQEIPTGYSDNPQKKLLNVAITTSSTLEELLSYALKHNPGLMANAKKVQSKIASANLKSSLPDPIIRYGYFVNEVETRTGPQQHRLGISQSIPFPGKLGLEKTIGLKAAAADSAHWEQSRLDLIKQVTQVWYEYAYLIKASDLMENTLELLNYLEGVVRTKYITGLTPQSSLLKVQIEVETLKDRLQDISDMETSLKTKLNALLNRQQFEPLPRPESIGIYSDDLNDSLWHKQLVESSSVLSELRIRMESTDSVIKLAKKENLPSFTLGIDYIFTGDAINPSLSESGKDPFIATISMNIPLWRGKNKSRVEAARAHKQAAASNYQSMKNTLTARLQTVLYAFRESKRKIYLYSNSLIPRMHQAYEVTRTAFEAGEVDFPELIDSQRTLLEMQLMLEREKANFNQHFAELELLTGRGLPKGEN